MGYRMSLPENYVDQIMSVYPSRMGHQGKEKLRTLIPRLHFTWGVTWESIMNATRNYRTLMDRTGKTGTEYVIAASRFFDDRDKLYDEYSCMDMRTPEQVAADNQWTQIAERAAKVGHQVDRSRPIACELERVNAAERKVMEQQWASRGLNAPKFQVVK